MQNTTQWDISPEQREIRISTHGNPYIISDIRIIVGVHTWDIILYLKYKL